MVRIIHVEIYNSPFMYRHMTRNEHNKLSLFGKNKKTILTWTVIKWKLKNNPLLWSGKKNQWKKTNKHTMIYHCRRPQFKILLYTKYNLHTKHPQMQSNGTFTELYCHLKFTGQWMDLEKKNLESGNSDPESQA